MWAHNGEQEPESIILKCESDTWQSVISKSGHWDKKNSIRNSPSMHEKIDFMIQIKLSNLRHPEVCIKDEFFKLLFLLVLGMGCAFLLWHSLGLPLIILGGILFANLQKNIANLIYIYQT